MSAGLWNVEWPNVNTQRKYPLAEGQNAVDGDFVIPDDFLVDMSLPVDISIMPDPTLFHVLQIGVFSGGATVMLGYNGTPFTLISVPFAGFTNNTTYALTGISAALNVQGWVTIGQIDSIMQSPGVFSFSPTTARIAPAVIRPGLRSLAGIGVRNGSDVSGPFFGDVILAAGRNMRLRVEDDGGMTRVIFDAIERAGFTEDCECLDNDQTNQTPIRTINGISPTPSGDFILRNAEGVQISGSNGVLAIDDSSAVPCCGCEELRVLVDTLRALHNQISTLDMSAENVAETLYNLVENVLAARFGDIPRTGPIE